MSRRLCETWELSSDSIAIVEPMTFKKYIACFVAPSLLAMAGHDTSERISRLEKQDQELQAELKRNEAAVDISERLTEIPRLAKPARRGAPQDCGYSYLSTAIATAFPPPKHNAAIPRFTSRRIIS